MANGLMYPTGVSTQPIDLTSGAQSFMQSAIEARLGEIESSKQQISESAKNVMKAMSVKALPELARAQRDRYQKEIEDYRQNVINKFKDRQGKLTLQDQKEIQDGFVDLDSRMRNEIGEMKIWKEHQKKMYDPNADLFYDMNRLPMVLAEGYGRMMRGEPLGNIGAEVAGTIKPRPITDYAFKRFGKDIEGFDILSRGKWINDRTFEFTSEQDEREVDDFINYMFKADPSITNHDTIENRDRLKQALIQRTKKLQPYRSYAGRGKEYEPYATTTPETLTVASDGKDIDVEYKGSISTTEVPTFSYGGKKVASEGIYWMPVVKDATKYDKVISDKDKQRYEEAGEEAVSPTTKTKQRFVTADIADGFKAGDYSVEPYVKIVVPKTKGVFRTMDDILGLGSENYTIEYVPLSNQNIRSALFGRMMTKRAGYEAAINEMNQKVGGGVREESVEFKDTDTITYKGETYTIGELFDEYRKNPKYKGVSDEDLRKAIIAKFK